MTLFLIGPFIGAVVTALFGRWRRVAALCGLLTAVILWLLLRLEPAARQSGTLFGSVLVFTPEIRTLFLFLYAGLAVLFALALVSPQGVPQGGKLVPASLAAFGFLALALLARPFLIGAFFLAMGLALLTVAIQDDRAGSVQGGLRYLVVTVFALPFLLGAAWLADTQTAAAGESIGRVALWGGLILLAAFPFHVWATTIVREASPLAWLLVFGLAQLVVTLFVFSLMGGGVNGEMARLVEFTAVLTLLVALLLLLTAVTLRRLVGGLLLADMAGVALLLVANPALRGETAVTIHMARFFSLVFIAVALQMWQPFGGALTAAGETDDQRRSQGMARRAPLTTLVLLVGCLSLAGLPLTLGFGGRWLVINLLLASDSTILALLLLATMGAGVLALLRAMPYWLAWHP
ncbi:MAG TPA: proton-conducting transporter membrane subunit [Chloroflexota bacterium]|nr:proton-conducting transporter membrane subunit [Chloroflexota bacterium]